jgi:uncharacterized protein (DUF1800 family)
MLWLYRLIFTPHPLAEVMTLAWHSHYATSQAKVNSPELMLKQNLTFRTLWRSPISQLHRKILTDGAMLRWLDGLGSTRVQPNENLAREFLELFALGEGNYSERDVRAVARALTGWRENDRQRKLDDFDAYDHDDGQKTILGETGAWGGDDVVRIACRQPAAATHVARRIYRTFISDTDAPQPELLAPLAGAMRTDGDVDVGRGIEILLRSRLFHSDECRSRRVKSPMSFVIGAIRSCEAFAVARDPVELEIDLMRMGQRLFYPPSVGGWTGGLTWLRGSTLLARSNFALRLTDPAKGLDLDHFRRLSERYKLESPESWLDAMSTLLLGVPLTADCRADLLAGGRSRALGASVLANLLREILSRPEAQVG